MSKDNFIQECIAPHLWNVYNFLYYVGGRKEGEITRDRKKEYVGAN